MPAPQQSAGFYSPITVMGVRAFSRQPSPQLALLIFGLTIVWLPTVSPANAQCVGDCNADERVAIDELIFGVNIVLRYLPVEDCLAFDRDGSAGVGLAI